MCTQANVVFIARLADQFGTFHEQVPADLKTWDEIWRYLNERDYIYIHNIHRNGEWIRYA